MLLLLRRAVQLYVMVSFYDLFSPNQDQVSLRKLNKNQPDLSPHRELDDNEWSQIQNL